MSDVIDIHERAAMELERRNSQRRRQNIRQSLRVSVYGLTLAVMLFVVYRRHQESFDALHWIWVQLFGWAPMPLVAIAVPILLVASFVVDGAHMPIKIVVTTVLALLELAFLIAVFHIAMDALPYAPQDACLLLALAILAIAQLLLRPVAKHIVLHLSDFRRPSTELNN